MRFITDKEYDDKSVVNDKSVYPNTTERSTSKSHSDMTTAVSLNGQGLVILNYRKLMAFVLSCGSRIILLYRQSSA